MTTKHERKRVGKVGIAVMGILMTFSGLLGVGAGTAIKQPPHVDRPETILVVNSYHHSSDMKDATPEIKRILHRAQKHEISADLAMAEIFDVLPLERLGQAAREKIRSAIEKVITFASAPAFEEFFEALADAIKETSQPLPTPLPTPSYQVRPSGFVR